MILNSRGFDTWAKEYDKSVSMGEEADEYPFAGYRQNLNEIYSRVHAKLESRVLDIGLGTGELTTRLYNGGHEITGIDFSAAMIEIARVKMPEATFFCRDFTDGLPKELYQDRFDFIVSTYAVHHISDKMKVSFILSLSEYLTEDGEILLGDVAFKTRYDLEKCRIESGAAWDNDEAYIVFEEIEKEIKIGILEFFPMSHCAGVLRFSLGTSVLMPRTGFFSKQSSEHNEHTLVHDAESPRIGE